MRVGSLFFALAWGTVLAPATVALGLETDQFTVPPEPLPDAGQPLAERVRAAVQAAINQANEAAERHRRLAASAGRAEQVIRHRHRMHLALREQTLARHVFDRLGRGGISAPVETWLRKLEVDGSPLQFQVSYAKSIYSHSGLTRPLLALSMTPTVNLFGVYTGTDKLGHFFQQGYESFRVYHEHLNQSGDPDAARSAAVEHGRLQEQGIYGRWPTGTYSNADLAANYAGFKFYLNLTRPMAVGGSLQPAIVIRKGEGWALNPVVQTDFIRPFISHHFNESMNPSAYAPSVRRFIRQAVAERTEAWFRFYQMTPLQQQTRLRALTTWHGEDYGHSGLHELVTISDPAP